MSDSNILFLSILLGALLVRLIFVYERKRRDEKAIALGGDPAESTQKVALKTLPLRLRIRNRFKLWFSTDQLQEIEFMTDYDSDSRWLAISFYAARDPVKITITLREGSIETIDAFERCSNGKWAAEKFGYTYQKSYGTTVVSVYPEKLGLAEKVRIKTQFGEDNWEGAVNVFAEKYSLADRKFLSEATQDIAIGRHHGALESYREYYKVARTNPAVESELFTLNMTLERHASAEMNAIRCMSYGQMDLGCSLYDTIISENPFVDEKKIPALVAARGKWSLSAHHGLVNLLQETSYKMGFNGFFVESRRDIIIVERPSAARFLTHIRFDVGSSGYLLYTGARIVRESGEIEIVSRERFSMGDDPGRNIAITTEHDRVGHWALPDLKVGDVIEYVCHFLKKEFPEVNKRPHFFLFDRFTGNFPTLKSRFELRCPAEWKLQFKLENTTQTVEEGALDEFGMRPYTAQVERITPRFCENLDYDNLLLNPTIACCFARDSWDDVMAQALEKNFGSLDTEDSLPGALKDIVSASQSKDESLEKCFYWIRDRLKYGAYESALKHIGSSSRAENILASGLADCKDKSYLLYLVGRHLDLDLDIIAVSSKYGTAVAELPANQFDHVLVRAKTERGWEYLDAANSQATFGDPPLQFQELNGLILNGAPSIIKLPKVDPQTHCLEISETFTGCDGNWLTGTFVVSISGPLGRQFDEAWKSQSLSTHDPALGAQDTLSSFLPNLRLIESSKLSDTSDSSLFAVSGVHKRCQMSSIRGQSAGILRWLVPGVNLHRKIVTEDGASFAFMAPLSISITLSLSGELAGRLTMSNDTPSLDTEVCDINGTYKTQNGATTIHRNIVIKERRVSQRLSGEMPKIMESLERALQVGLILNHRSENR